MRFRWEYRAARTFAAIVTAIGVSSAKPREIKRFFPAHYGLDTSPIGSHL